MVIEWALGTTSEESMQFYFYSECIRLKIKFPVCIESYSFEAD
jgi:hypothetical protein